MAIPNFYEQSQSALRSGMALGQGLTQAAEMQRQRELEEQQAPFRQQLLEQQAALGQAQVDAIPAQNAASKLRMQEEARQIEERTKDDLNKNIIQDAVMLSSFSFDREAQDALFPELINKYSEMKPDLVPALNELYQMDDKERTSSLLQLIGGMSGELRKEDKDKTASVRDYEYWQELKKTDPEAAKAFGRQSGFDRLTKEEEADLKVETKGREEGIKGTVSRKQGFIDTGVEAADSLANLQRTRQLLDQVKTGGFDNVAFRAKQLFGVEGADEGELSANLGIAVLAQLKPIFGAAFTAAEGERLERISARFGANPETNKRLIDQAISITERAARRGLRAAIDQGDDFTANEIKTALDAVKKIKEDIQPASRELLQPVIPNQAKLGEQQSMQQAPAMNMEGLSPAAAKYLIGVQ